MTKQRQKLRLFFCTLVVISLLFPTSSVFAETVQDVPVGESTISSRAEDPLKEYKEKTQNQASTVESVISQDVPEKTSELDTFPTELEGKAGDFPTLASESSEEQSEMTNQRIEPQGDIVPLAGTILVEGLPSDSFPYDIDKNFADVLRESYGAPTSVTDDFMKRLTVLNIGERNLTSLKGIEYAVNVTTLFCDKNQITELDVSSNTKLEFLNCNKNQLTELDVSSNTKLVLLSCSENQITELDVSSNTKLENLSFSENQLTKIDVSNNTALEYLEMNFNKLTSLKGIEYAPNLRTLLFSVNEISELNVSSNPKLEEVGCVFNQLSELDISNNPLLTYLAISFNKLGKLDVSKAPLLTDLLCSNNQLSELDVSSNSALTTLNCSNNRISDISSANGLTELIDFDASNQQITVPVPTVSLTGEATVDILRTTAQKGLTATNGNVNPAPANIRPNANNGDLIDLTGVSRDSLSEKSINFRYAGSALQEGASSYSEKSFSGTITFELVSELKNELQVSPNKVENGEELTWTWTITSLTEMTAEDIKANFILPNYVNGDISDIMITKGEDSYPGSINLITGKASLRDLEQGESIKITFKSVVKGNPDEWLEAIGRLDWSDTTPSSPQFNEARQSYKILDEEQQDLSKGSDDMGILSAPIRFYFGRQNISSSIKTYDLDAQNYQTNTKVVTDGFYTRINDDQVISSGWKLTASLSEFQDSVGQQMPKGLGASLMLKNMSIQKVIDRDTPQEAIDPSPTGTPTTVQTDEILVTGQTAKTLVSAQTGEGQGTWQLRMPFDDISLTLPARAGKKEMVYTAKLTWSLNNTP